MGRIAALCQDAWTCLFHAIEALSITLNCPAYGMRTSQRLSARSISPVLREKSNAGKVRTGKEHRENSHYYIPLCK